MPIMATFVGDDDRDVLFRIPRSPRGADLDDPARDRSTAGLGPRIE
jgi:hypothetical protein